ncbi:MAG TPA: hypothetical protein VM452_08070 [Caulifigura sp.]|jgi:hypothetical protein|nr:hypothetical protein [Caulifigura sp.]
MNRSLTTFLFLAACVFHGCGSSGPEIGAVTGTVLLDGRPVEGAMLFFEPKKGGRSSKALTDASGKYELQYIGERMGALIGEHQVRITKSRKTTYEDNGKIRDKGMPEIFPKTANSETNLTADVVAGSNTFDFDLKSK